MARAQQACPRRSPRNHRTLPPPPLLTEVIVVRQSDPERYPLRHRGHFCLTFIRGHWYAQPLAPIYPPICPIYDDDELSGISGPQSWTVNQTAPPIQNQRTSPSPPSTFHLCQYHHNINTTTTFHSTTSCEWLGRNEQVHVDPLETTAHRRRHQF